MKALYVGKNGIGLENGFEYEISSKIVNGKSKFYSLLAQWIRSRPVIWITIIGPEKKVIKCPYGSLEAFSKNWIITERL